MVQALRQHWREYVIEGAGLGIFMLSAGLFGTLFEYPGSSIYQSLSDPIVRRILTGLAMGATAVGIIYSPWGKQSGAHINPAVTMTFLRLGKVKPWDASFYVLSQFAGATLGVLAVLLVLGSSFGQPPVRFAATLPGSRGAVTAFAAELIISLILMWVILSTTNAKKWARYTGLFAGALVAIYIVLEQPLSGMSMNPARTFGSALPGRIWTGLWIYFTAPPMGMLLAAELYIRRHGSHGVKCAKLHHQNNKRCIFRCGYGQQPTTAV